MLSGNSGYVSFYTVRLSCSPQWSCAAHLSRVGISVCAKAASSIRLPPPVILTANTSGSFFKLVICRRFCDDKRPCVGTFWRKLRSRTCTGRWSVYALHWVTLTIRFCSNPFLADTLPTFSRASWEQRFTVHVVKSPFFGTINPERLFSLPPGDLTLGNFLKGEWCLDLSVVVKSYCGMCRRNSTVELLATWLTFVCVILRSQSRTLVQVCIQFLHLLKLCNFCWTVCYFVFVLVFVLIVCWLLYCFLLVYF